MKNLLIILSASLLLVGCTTIQNRVPAEALQDDNVIYVSQQEYWPKEVLELVAKQAMINSLMGVNTPSNQVTAKFVIPPEVLIALINGLIKGFETGSTTYFNYRQNVVIVNREWLIRGVSNSLTTERIVKEISDSLHKSVIPE